MKDQTETIVSRSAQPSIYSKRHIAIAGNTFLWLSDLHFTNGVLSVKAAANKKSLADHIRHCDTEPFKDISGLIISGDITDCCHGKGFETAEIFIADLNKNCNFRFDPDNIIMCPGNHDLKRENCKVPEYDPELFSKNTETAALYTKFFKNIYHINPNEFLTCGRKFLTASSKSVEIASLNTVMLQQYENFEGHGYISSEQLEFVEKSMGWTECGGFSSCRIVVMHHHYCPACLSEIVKIKKPASVVYDADRLMQWIVKNNVKLLLHGHKHNKFLSKVSYPKNRNDKINAENMHDVYVVSAGGLGAKDSEHTFGTITFEADSIIIRIYRINTDNIGCNKCIQTITIPMSQYKNLL